MRRMTVILVASFTLLLMSAIPALAQQNGIYYTVRGGDTLGGIAAFYGVSQHAIIEANSITHPNTIFAGQHLFIPLGNTPIAPPGSTLQPTYTVQPGDNLFRIAHRFGVSLTELARVNGISNISRVQAGRVLVLPTGSQASPPPVVNPPPSYATRYHVQRGDTLRRIAHRFGVSVHDLLAVNHIANPNLIYVGQTLIIP